MTKYKTYEGLHSLHPLPVAWRNMLSRCENPNNNRYNTYGARGITVCVAWHKFAIFYRDMGASWKEELQLDRIDNSKGYFKENCQWVSLKENTRKRTTAKLTEAQALEIRQRFATGTAYQKQLAAEFGVSDRMIRYIGNGDWWK